ncbi:MAG: ABC transporter substrate-binding protein [Reinekea sp.]
MKQHALIFALLISVTSLASADQGVYSNRIVIGGVMDLEGQSRGLGFNMKAGIDAAFDGVRVKGKMLEYKVLNDSYTPELTAKQTTQLIDEDIFAMLGNVGTPTAQASLPLLADARIPAVGFFTGAGLLRPGVGDVINFRASYIQEATTVVSNALKAGLQPKEICAFVQNDSYGMSGVEGIRSALRGQPNSREVILKLGDILSLEGENVDRNNIGPVGVYQRNTLASRDGYDSLKKWETTQNIKCKLVVTVGTYASVGRFAGYSRYKGEDWVISAVSFTGADNLSNVLKEFYVNDRIVMTQVVPDLSESLPIVVEAQKALGDNFNYVSLEGYMTGKMFIHILNSIDGDITRTKFVQAATDSEFDLGGVPLAFSNDNQGSDLVTTIYYSDKEYRSMTSSDWLALF